MMEKSACYISSLQKKEVERTIEESVFVSYMIINHKFMDENLVWHHIDNVRIKAKKSSSIFETFFLNLSSELRNKMIMNESTRYLSEIVKKEQLDTICFLEHENNYQKIIDNTEKIFETLQNFVEFINYILNTRNISLVNMVYLYDDKCCIESSVFNTSKEWASNGRMILDNEKPYKIICPVFDLENHDDKQKVVIKFVSQEVYEIKQTKELYITTTIENKKQKQNYELLKLKQIILNIENIPIRETKISENFINYSLLQGYAKLNESISEENKIYYIIKTTLSKKINNLSDFKFVKQLTDIASTLASYLVVVNFELNVTVDTEIEQVYETLSNYDHEVIINYLSIVLDISKKFMLEVEQSNVIPIKLSEKLSIEERLKKIKKM